MRIILACALAAILSVPAKADEVLRYRFFVHQTKSDFQDVGDVEGHIMGVAHLSGLVSLSDGSVGTVFWTIGFDYIKGAGPATAYGKTTLADGSAIWWKSVANAVPNDKTVTWPNSLVTVLSGTGRFAGAKGDGIAAERIGPPGLGSEYAGEATLNIKK